MSWIATFSGIEFDPINPRPQDISIVDISVGLANTSRFTGQTIYPYSVAQHSVLMLEYAVEQGLVREYSTGMMVLLHDASEAYIADVARPLKPLLTNYSEIERHLMNTIASRFGFLTTEHWPKWLHDIDVSICLDERQALMPNPTKTPWSIERTHKPLGIKIEYWPFDVARQRFIQAFQALNELQV